MIDERKPTLKQLRYINNLIRYKRNVPAFTGVTIKDASEFIAKYKNYPDKEYDWSERRPEWNEEEYPHLDYDENAEIYGWFNDDL